MNHQHIAAWNQKQVLIRLHPDAEMRWLDWLESSSLLLPGWFVLAGKNRNHWRPHQLKYMAPTLSFPSWHSIRTKNQNIYRQTCWLIRPSPVAGSYQVSAY